MAQNPSDLKDSFTFNGFEYLSLSVYGITGQLVALVISSPRRAGQLVAKSKI